MTPRTKRFLVLLLSLLVSASLLPASAFAAGRPLVSALERENPPARSLMGISVTTLPDKTEYVTGELFDPTGMVVTATYSDETSRPVTEYAISPDRPLSPEDRVIDIRYSEGGMTINADVSITVQEPGTVKSITTLASSADEIVSSTSLTITATAKDDVGQPASSGALHLYVNGNAYVRPQTPQYGADTTWTVAATEANGFSIGENEITVTFTGTKHLAPSEAIIWVTVVAPPQGDGSSIPETGDAAGLGLWAGLTLLSFAGLFAVNAARHRRKA